MPKIRIEKGENQMFNDEFIQEIFLNRGLFKIPEEYIPEAIHAFETILEDKLKEDGNATLSQLFMA